eukprot:CAMPEP_0174276580 /NCGR_PEP_ID=MMETSP0439-20130205/60468_1 /TAXON_ID=0 /ORGANISM="Stereomyxa ramosa, Strain Chinc5" /LENGTH=298 /DNA_ID=CAMNT_0015368827 /DNA_START=80 /DNA_END=976 /DNA_ORIENTATION=+
MAYHHEKVYNESDDLHLVDDDPHDQEKKTLFIRGFPADVKHREVHNLFHGSPGYEDSIIKPSGIVFASFSSHSCASAAKDKLEGHYFDPDSAVPLHTEFAKQNSKRKRDVAELEPEDREFWSPVRIKKRLKYVATGRLASGRAFPFAAPAAAEPYGIYNAYGYGGAYGGAAGYSSAALMGMPGAEGYMGVGAAGSMAAIPGYEGLSRAPKPSRFPPCTTLYVGNLGPGAQEAEINEIFGRCQGFEKCVLTRKADIAHAFLKFRDIDSSAAAMQTFQGISLETSGRGPIRLEYAKNKTV